MTNLTVFYDNWCPNCSAFTNTIKKLDTLNLFTIKQIRNKTHLASFKDLDRTLAEQQMASYNGKWNYGYNSLYEIFLRLPLAWFFIPILLLLKVSKIGQFLYIQLAVNRQIIPIHCTDENCEYLPD